MQPTTNKQKIVKDITDRPSIKNRNDIRLPKPLSFTTIVFAALALIVFVVLTITCADEFSANTLAALTAVEATLVSVSVLAYTANRESRSRYIEARKDAKLLYEILEFVDNQIKRLEKDLPLKIAYPENWIDYYRSCAGYLTYNYLSELLREFDLVEKINASIEAGDKQTLAALIQYRHRLFTDSTADFDILDVRFNLSFFASGQPEWNSWKTEKQFHEFRDYIAENYAVKIKELTVEYLKNHGNTCDADDACRHVMTILQKETGIRDGKYKYQAMENKKLLKSIYFVYMTLEETDPFSLCWGELSLN